MSDGTAGTEPGFDEPPPEAVLLRRVRKASGISLQQAARAAGISKAWLSSLETGHDTRSRRGDGTRPVRASDEIVARLARFYGISPDRLETEGQRPDAAEVLREILRPAEQAQTAAPATSEGVLSRDDLVEDAVRAALEHYRAEVRARLAEMAAEREAGRSA